jgi:hypothetical protein
VGGVTDPFDTVRCGLYEPDTRDDGPEEVLRYQAALAALASIEERLAELESELTDSEINFRDQLDRARAAERKAEAFSVEMDRLSEELRAAEQKN